MCFLLEKKITLAYARLSLICYPKPKWALRWANLLYSIWSERTHFWLWEKSWHCRGITIAWVNMFLFKWHWKCMIIMSGYCSYLGRFPIFGKTRRFSITAELNEINSQKGYMIFKMVACIWKIQNPGSNDSNHLGI